MDWDIIEKMESLVGFLKMWDENKDKPEYLGKLIAEVEEYLAEQKEKLGK